MEHEEREIHAHDVDLSACWNKIIAGATEVVPPEPPQNPTRTKRANRRRKGTGRSTQMNLKVIAGVRHEFLSIARHRKVSMGELLEQVLAEWKAGGGRP